MIIDEQNAKRLIAYFIYDKQGIVDDYIIYMLRALKEHSSEIAVVVNGKLTPESREKLSEITPVIMVRENKGLDVWAYKTVLDYYGWDKLVTYDEVIMMNFTIMGPVYPLSEMFENMSARDLDFWGITMYHKYEKGDPFETIECGYIPDHIQSHFIAVRTPMLKSIEFQQYWDNMQEIKDYRDAVGCHEAMFTKRFSEKGFKWDVYADMGEGYNNHPILCATREMLEEKRCPIFKRRSFMQDYSNIIHDTVGQEAIEAYEFIDKHTDYDVNLIWDNILRLENQADIKKNMQLNYILDSKHGTDISEVLKKKKVALVLHFYFEDLAEYCLHYVQSMPKEADIYVTVGSEKKKKIIEETFSGLENNVKVILIENRGRDVSALLVGTKDFIMDYDYVCFAHDKKVTQLTPETIGAGFAYKCFENLLPTKEFVQNVIRTFEENPRAGLLTPPPPNHGDYYITLGLEWGLNYEVTVKLAEKLGLTVPIDEKKEPVAPLGTMFWFRPQALKLLFDQDWEYKDFPPEPNNIDGTLLHAVERIYSYVVQQEGYYPAWILSDKGARIEMTNLNYMVRGLNNTIFHMGPGAGNFEDVQIMTKQAFGEWRMCRSALGYTKGNVIRSKMYLKTKEGYSEENSFIAENSVDEVSHLDDREFLFTDLEKMGVVDALRWDPGEAGGIVIRQVLIKVLFQNGHIEEYTLKDAVSNGVMVDDELVFIAPDPQLNFNLRTAGIIQKITVQCDFMNSVSTQCAQKIYDKIGGKKPFRLLKKVYRKLTKR
ncbi:MAG: rhamnan synthesis F family protein [Lachnospiraceae bacterium]|nr:rhamnan synthesis F family protein [Lachnospiraceae bacterium]